ncbi:MAG: Maf family protein [Hyphomicrobium sp.]|nr:Maf family protein [Hyphomicrobium sp.]
MAERLRVVLASQSRSRRTMLEQAGLIFDVVPSDVDEAAMRATFEPERALDEDYPIEVAEMLAAAKAVDVSVRLPDALVIGCDQVLALATERRMEFGGKRWTAASYEIFEKPADMAAARAHLSRLRGRAHQLHASVAIAQGGEVLWTCTDSAELSMRDFSDDFLAEYLSRAGERVCESVGAYQLEGLGVQLFEEIAGDYFTILGMPLLPLREELRERGVLSM